MPVSNIKTTRKIFLPSLIPIPCGLLSVKKDNYSDCCVRSVEDELNTNFVKIIIYRFNRDDSKYLIILKILPYPHLFSMSDITIIKNTNFKPRKYVIKFIKALAR